MNPTSHMIKTLLTDRETEAWWGEGRRGLSMAPLSSESNRTPSLSIPFSLQLLPHQLKGGTFRHRPEGELLKSFHPPIPQRKPSMSGERHREARGMGIIKGAQSQDGKQSHALLPLGLCTCWFRLPKHGSPSSLTTFYLSFRY